LLPTLANATGSPTLWDCSNALALPAASGAPVGAARK
jgi:hypothetical protein